MARDLSSLGHALVGFIVVESVPGKFIVFAVTIRDHQSHWILQTKSLHNLLEWLSVGVAFLGQSDGYDVAAFGSWLVEGVGLAVL